MIAPFRELPAGVRALLAGDSCICKKSCRSSSTGSQSGSAGKEQFKTGDRYKTRVSNSKSLIITEEGALETKGYEILAYYNNWEYRRFNPEEFAEYFEVPEVDTIDKTDIKRYEMYHNYVKTVYETYKLIEYEFQIEDVAKLLMVNGAILSHHQGMGKTISGLVWMRIKKILNPEIKRTLVIAQQNLLNQWIEEAAKIGINLRRINKKTSGEQELEDADYITHFEFIKDNYRKYTDKFNLIILDEGHKIKTGKAQRGIAIRSLQAKYKMCLTGTPIKNIVKDLHFLMGWVFGFDSSVYPYKENEQHKFRKDYGVYEIKNGHRRLIPMASNIEELQYLVAPAILRRSISETGVKMVKNSVYRIGCDFTPEQLLEYERIKESDINPTSKRHEFCKITTIYPGNEKLELLKRLVRSCIVNNEQVIVFTGIVDTGLKYKEIFGDNARLVNGLLTPPVQERLINEFKAGEYPVLIGGLEAVNTGHSLQNASNVIVTDYPWTASTLDQAIARIFRIVSKKDVRVYLLYTKGSNDEDRMNLINIKREGAGEVLDREKYYTDIHIDYRSLQIQK